MKGTKLWQAPGSPIIQGRSRTERPFWERWLGGFLGAEALVLVSALLLTLRQPSQDFGATMTSVVVSYLLPSIPGCLVGAAIGVWLSRTMGWRRHWLVGAIAGALLAAITLAFF